jgi:hypothetical protein
MKKEKKWVSTSNYVFDKCFLTKKQKEEKIHCLNRELTIAELNDDTKKIISIKTEIEDIKSCSLILEWYTK